MFRTRTLTKESGGLSSYDKGMHVGESTGLSWHLEEWDQRG